MDRSKTSLLARTEAMNARYFSRDNDPFPWKPGDLTAPGEVTHPTMIYAVQSPFTGLLHYPTAGRHWGSEKKRMKNLAGGMGLPYEERDIRRRKAEGPCHQGSALAKPSAV